MLLPSVEDANFAGIYTGVNHVLTESGYQVFLAISSEIQAREHRALGQFIKQRVEGLILVTCQPESAAMFQSIIDNGTPMVFVERKPGGEAFPLVEYNNAAQVKRLVADILRKGYQTPLLITGPHDNSSERSAWQGFADALRETGGWNEDAAIETNFTKESAFSSLITRLSGLTRPDVIIATSIPLLLGARQAVRILEFADEPDFVGLGGDSWLPFVPDGTQILHRNAMAMGEAAGALLLELLSGNSEARGKQLQLDSARFYTDTTPKIRKSVRLRSGGKKLRVLMLQGSACTSVAILLPSFHKNAGIEVEIVGKSLPDITEIFHSVEERRRYDILQVDQPWLGEAAEDGFLYCLDEWLQARPEMADYWLPGITDAYCRYRESSYSVPYLFSTQLLFYRKDIFDDPHLSSRFRKRHHYDLRAPKNWHEFIQMAAFFTRSLNPDSPVDFGVTLGGSNPNGAVCEFMPRMLAFNNSSLDSGNLMAVMASPATEAALANYVDSYRFAPPGSVDFWWDEQVEVFTRGAAAMMILYHGHVASLVDRNYSRVVGKIGYDLLPGGMPILGGWTLGINRQSDNLVASLDFLDWICNPDLAVPLTLLGGSPPSTRVYHNSELCAFYPWLPKTVESFNRSSQRNITKVTSLGKIDNYSFENILGNAVHRAITGELSPASALQTAMEIFQKLK
jgi:DNA-binding LacI/PurR family transcriptional regulator/ABC-type glycerol-3-phosphate transport system substrate-binding protein